MIKVKDLTPEQAALYLQAKAELIELERRAALVDELIAALEDAFNQIQYLHEKFSITGSGAQVLARIETALKKARG